MEEVENLFSSVDQQKLEIWTMDFWDKIRKSEKGMERAEKKWLLDQLTSVLAHLMTCVQEKNIAHDDRCLMLFWLNYGNVRFFFLFLFFFSSFSFPFSFPFSFLSSFLNSPHFKNS